MKLDLISLKLTNFMGQKDFVLNANGNDVLIFADNGVGKSTIATAFQWLFTGKNIRNEADFDIKDTSGKIPDGGINHEVEAVLVKDGKTITFKKVFYEKYTKKRGSLNEEFSGHSIDHFIDGVPVPEKEYLACLDQLFPQKYFQILTSPLFFNYYLKGKDGEWKERRKTLTDLFGDITDDEVIANSPELKELPAILNGKSPDKYKEIIKARQKDIQKKIEEIGPRIDEIVKGMPDVSGLDLTQLNGDLQFAQKQLIEKQGELSRIQNGEELTKKRLDLRRIETDIAQMENKHQENINVEVSKKQESKTPLLTELAELKVAISGYEQTKIQNNTKIKTLESELNLLRQKWQELNAKVFEWNPPTIASADCCPECSQPISLEIVERLKKVSEEKFNLEKSTALENNVTEGKQKKQTVIDLTAANQDLDAKISKATAKQNELNIQITAINTEINQIKQIKLDSPEYQQKLNEKSNIISEITKLQDGSKDLVDGINAEIEKINKMIQAINVDIAKFTTIDESNKRIEELQKQQKDLAVEFEKCNKELFLIETFTKLKVSSLEEKINSHFKLTRWKLFENQINGGIAECCLAMHNHVSSKSNLNTGMEINVGLDIINAISEKLQLFLPVFIDGCESITRPIATKGQQIKLIVSEPDKCLRVEVVSRPVAA
jgi:DNA repair exonuclease SbcCD ATPase subunit